MYPQEEITDELHEKFCKSIVPVSKVSHKFRGIIQTEEYLDMEKFPEKLDGFFSSVSPVMPKKSLERIQDLLEESFIIGESHLHISPKKFLIDNMKKMKENGYDILFMEHLFYDTNQKDLDDFFKTGEISADLMAQLKEMNRGGMSHFFGPTSKITSPLWKENDYIAVLRAAREAGIRIVGIDISTVYKSQKIGIDNQQLDDTRIRYMNYTAAQIMEREISLLPIGKKWCGLMGNTHVKTFENTIGVAEIFGARSVYVFDHQDWMDSTEPSKSEMELDSEFILSKGRQIFKGDVIYQTDPRLQQSLFEKPLEHSSSVYKEKLAHIVQPQMGLTTNEIDLAIKYLASLEVTELGKLFGFDGSKNGLDNSYYFVQKITPINEKKPIEQNNTFSISLESIYSNHESHILYLSRDQLLGFSTKQREIDLEFSKQLKST